MGKLRVAEEILGRPGPLDAAARAEVEMHPAPGVQLAPWAVDVIEGIVHTLGEVSSDEFLRS